MAETAPEAPLFRKWLTRNLHEYRALPEERQVLLWRRIHFRNRRIRVRARALIYTVPLFLLYMNGVLHRSAIPVGALLLLFLAFLIANPLITQYVEEAHTCRLLRQQLREGRLDAEDEG